ncbi:MAG: glycosyl hydrolase 53 family protein [Gemmatimonadales bacterium]|jgi:arabinogalactan endo-1,4-beta-galactosidase
MTIRVVKLLAAGSLALLFACDGSAPTEPLSLGSAFLGADISALERIEQGGAVFRDAGQAGDAITILHAHGSTVFRLRLFVNPDHQDVRVNDLAYTLRMAERIKAAGARLLLDLHYSDTWADPGHQTTPAAWASLAFDSLEQQVETYSDSVIAQLRQAGVLPDIVQVGNEVDAGMLWPSGQLYVPGGDTLAEWDHFTRLLKAGIRGVRAALGPGDSLRVMLHYSQGGDTGGTQWFFDHMAKYGVPYDLIGLSYYPWWHGTLGQLQANLSATALRYGKDVAVVETSYPWRAGGWESMATDLAAMTWPVTAQGQAQFLRDVLDAVAAVPNGRGAGVMWWYPEAIQVSDLSVWGGGSLALFDGSGDILPAAGQFIAR